VPGTWAGGPGHKEAARGGAKQLSGFCAQTILMDIILRNATIIDGTGAPSRPGDVGIAGGRIQTVGRIPGGAAAAGDGGAGRHEGPAAPAASTAPGVSPTPAGDGGPLELDCTGLIVAPGFINIHSHSDYSIFQEPSAANYVAQGVTLIVSGNCGFSAAPISLDDPEIAAAVEDPATRALITWTTYEEYFETLERLPKAINVAGLVGHGSVRAMVLGLGARTPTAGDMERMREHVREAMRAGAFGLSTGLIYVPGVFAARDEVVELARAAAEMGGIYATHLRSEADRLIDALIEAVDIGRASGARVQISHHKASGRHNWGLVRTALDLEEHYRTLGVEITCDVYPCTAGSTGLSALFPTWTHREGKEGFLRLLQDSEARERIKQDLSRPGRDWENLFFNGGAAGVVISDSKVYPEYLGLSIAEIAAETGRDPLDTMLDLVEADFDAWVLIHAMSEDDMRHVLAHRLSMVCDDGAVLRSGQGMPHPRTYRAFTRALATYARDEKVLTLEQAVHKMTGFPAWKLGLPDRGIIREGAVADLAVFNLWGLGCRSDFGDPHHLSEGMVHVLVGGEFVLRDGRPTEARPGRVITRPS